mgnify:FL=1
MTFEEVKKVTEILLEFLPNTLKLFAWTIVLSIPVGVLVTMLKKCRFKPISWLTNLYILVMRGTPLMLQIIAIYYAVPLIIASAAKQGKTGGVYDVLTNIKNNENYMFIALVTAFVLNYAAYFAEIFRGGIEAIPKGQYEAAAMLGFSKLQTFFRIILPQVVKRVIPASSNEVITLVKDTSLAYSMGYMEVMYIAKKQMTTFSSLTPLFMAGLFYFAMATILTMIFGLAEKKLNYYK